MSVFVHGFKFQKKYYQIDLFRNGEKIDNLNILTINDIIIKQKNYGVSQNIIGDRLRVNGVDTYTILNGIDIKEASNPLIKEYKDYYQIVYKHSDFLSYINIYFVRNFGVIITVGKKSKDLTTAIVESIFEDLHLDYSVRMDKGMISGNLIFNISNFKFNILEFNYFLFKYLKLKITLNTMTIPTSPKIFKFKLNKFLNTPAHVISITKENINSTNSRLYGWTLENALNQSKSHLLSLKNSKYLYLYKADSAKITISNIPANEIEKITKDILKIFIVLIKYSLKLKNESKSFSLFHPYLIHTGAISEYEKLVLSIEEKDNIWKESVSIMRKVVDSTSNTSKSLIYPYNYPELIADKYDYLKSTIVTTSFKNVDSNAQTLNYEGRTLYLSEWLTYINTGFEDYTDDSSTRFSENEYLNAYYIKLKNIDTYIKEIQFLIWTLKDYIVEWEEGMSQTFMNFNIAGIIDMLTTLNPEFESRDNFIHSPEDPETNRLIVLYNSSENVILTNVDIKREFKNNNPHPEKSLVVVSTPNSIFVGIDKEGKHADYIVPTYNPIFVRYYELILAHPEKEDIISLINITYKKAFTTSEHEIVPELIQTIFKISNTIYSKFIHLIAMTKGYVPDVTRHIFQLLFGPLLSKMNAPVTDIIKYMDPGDPAAGMIINTIEKSPLKKDFILRYGSIIYRDIPRLGIIDAILEGVLKFSDRTYTDYTPMRTKIIIESKIFRKIIKYKVFITGLDITKTKISLESLQGDYAFVNLDMNKYTDFKGDYIETIYQLSKYGDDHYLYELYNIYVDELFKHLISLLPENIVNQFKLDRRVSEMSIYQIIIIFEYILEIRVLPILLGKTDINIYSERDYDMFQYSISRKQIIPIFIIKENKRLYCELGLFNKDIIRNIFNPVMYKLLLNWKNQYINHDGILIARSFEWSFFTDIVFYTLEDGAVKLYKFKPISQIYNIDNTISEIIVGLFETNTKLDPKPEYIYIQPGSFKKTYYDRAVFMMKIKGDDMRPFINMKFDFPMINSESYKDLDYTIEKTLSDKFEIVVKSYNRFIGKFIKPFMEESFDNIRYTGDRATHIAYKGLEIIPLSLDNFKILNRKKTKSTRHSVRISLDVRKNTYINLITSHIIYKLDSIQISLSSIRSEIMKFLKNNLSIIESNKIYTKSDIPVDYIIDEISLKQIAIVFPHSITKAGLIRINAVDFSNIVNILTINLKTRIIHGNKFKLVDESQYFDSEYSRRLNKSEYVMNLTSYISKLLGNDIQISYARNSKTKAVKLNDMFISMTRLFYFSKLVYHISPVVMMKNLSPSDYTISVTNQNIENVEDYFKFTIMEKGLVLDRYKFVTMESLKKFLNDNLNRCIIDYGLTSLKDFSDIPVQRDLINNILNSHGITKTNIPKIYGLLKIVNFN